MADPTLADLITPVTQEEAYAEQLSLAAGVGLPTTAWQPVQAVPAIVNVNAQSLASASEGISNTAQGGYASLAAKMLNSDGSPRTDFMDLISKENYNTTRQPATFAAGPVPVVNTLAVSYPYGPSNPLHFQNATTGATYTTQGTGTIAASGSSTVNVQADVAGQGSTSGIGVTLTLTTPLAGVTVSPLTTSLVGSDEESNAALLSRDQAKLGTLGGSGGPSAAYDFIARSIPQGVPSSSPPYAVSSPITRTNVWLDTGSGDVNFVVANAAGTPSGTDIGVVNAAIQFQVDPDGVTVDVSGAVDVSIPLVATVYIKGSLATADAITNIEDGLANYAQTVPIGGVTTTAANIVPLLEIEDAIRQSNAGTIDVNMTSPSTPPGMGNTGVPVFTPITITVVQV